MSLHAFEMNSMADKAGRPDLLTRTNVACPAQSRIGRSVEAPRSVEALDGVGSALGPHRMAPGRSGQVESQPLGLAHSDGK